MTFRCRLQHRIIETRSHARAQSSVHCAKRNPVSAKAGLATRCLVLIALMIGLWVFVGPERSHACYCVPRGTPSEALAESAAVFAGKAVSVRELDRGDGIVSSLDPTTIEFEVATVWKGRVNQTMRLTTARGGASCGFSFDEGVEYIVYSENGSTVTWCSLTKPLSAAGADLAELGEGKMLTQGGVTRARNGPGQGAGGGCGASPHSTDLLFAGVLVGVAWLAVRKRHPDCRRSGCGKGKDSPL